MQNPMASYVAGFNKWRELGRYVKKGEKSIKIFAPIRYKLERENDDSSKHDIVYILKGFKLISVFDISQTDGDDSKLPTLVTGLKQDLQDASIYQKLLNIIEIPITEVDNISAKGQYNLQMQTIRIKSSLSSMQKVKTLLHEYTHHLHHTQHFNDELYDIGEVIAESTAYIVCNHLGINTSDYSIGYVNSWAKDIEVVKSVGSKIQLIAKTIIEKL